MKNNECGYEYGKFRRFSRINETVTGRRQRMDYHRHNPRDKMLSDWMVGFSKKSVASLICLGFVHSSKMSSNRKLSF